MAKYDFHMLEERGKCLCNFKLCEAGRETCAKEQTKFVLFPEIAHLFYLKLTRGDPPKEQKLLQSCKHSFPLQYNPIGSVRIISLLSPETCEPSLNFISSPNHFCYTIPLMGIKILQPLPYLYGNLLHTTE